MPAPTSTVEITQKPGLLAHLLSEKTTKALAEK